jgi:hypothetical protein
MTTSLRSSNPTNFQVPGNSCTTRYKQKQANPVDLVRERTIPPERPTLGGEISDNFCGRGMSRGQRGGSLRPFSQFSRPKPLHFLPGSSSFVLTMLSGPRSRSITSQKNFSVVYCSEFLAADPEVRVRFPAPPDFVRSSGSGTGSTQPRDTIEELLERKSSGSSLENRDYGRRGSAALTTLHSSIRKEVGTNFADNRRWLGRYNSLAD